MRFGAVLLTLAVLCVPFAAHTQPVSPAPGVEMPQAYFDRIASDPTAFQFQKAWIQKAQRAREAREEYFSRHPMPEGMSMASLPDAVRNKVAVSGTITVPMICIDYTNVSAPFTIPTVQNQYFDGPTTSDGTVTELYDEMSYGMLTMDGDVLGWVNGTNNDVHYEGGCNGLCGAANTGQLILEALNGVDGTTDFGDYDNDGPDGVPNSGDDDGFVDFIAIVHPESGGECGGTNMWSHRWVVTGWPQFAVPWQSNDAAFGGGFIQVLDYTVQPVQGGSNGCGAGINHIGVFGHEFGHAFGLPDYYDTNGGGQGIGEHGLMGSGNWQLSSNPTHMTSYEKAELGWVIPQVVDGVLQNYQIDAIETSADAYQLNTYEERFNRKTTAPIAGSASLHCLINASSAANRNWPGGAGYGNNFNERAERTFSYDGVSHPVTLNYDAQYDTEATYDFGRVIVRVNGVETVKASYDGNGTSLAESVDLTPQLNGSGATEYQVIFEFTSDVGWSDEDGSFNSGINGPFKVDNVSLTGGGENYSNDFETNVGGFCYVPSWTEYFLVENRSLTAGQFDNNQNGNGLQVTHVERTVNDNTSGSTTTSNLRPATIEIECADGLNQLLLGGNRGDAGDYWHPGTQTSFNDGTTPNTKNHSGRVTHAQIANISAISNSMTADLAGGFRNPTLSSITPSSGDNDGVLNITDLAGTRMYKGGTFCLDDGVTQVAATNVEWIDKTLIAGDLDLTGVPGGTYDVVWKAADGQEATIVDGFTVNDVATGIGDALPRDNALFQNSPNPFNPETTISYTIKTRADVQLRIYNVAGQLVRTLVDEVQSPSPAGFNVVWNGRSDAGVQVASGVYLYKLSVGSEFQAVKKLVLLK